MTYLVDHPGATDIPPEVAAFDTEAAAEAWAQRLRARGLAGVVVYYVADAALEPVCGGARSSAASRSEHGCKPLCRPCKAERAKERSLRSPMVRARGLWTQSPFDREDVAETYGEACFYCAGPFESVDHYQPISAGGKHTIENVRPACRSCNSRKGITPGPEFEWKASE